jgi:hypothetical protein
VTDARSDGEGASLGDAGDTVGVKSVARVAGAEGVACGDVQATDRHSVHNAIERQRTDATPWRRICSEENGRRLCMSEVVYTDVT